MAQLPTFTAQAVTGVPQLEAPNVAGAPMASAAAFYQGGGEGLNLQPLMSGLNQAADVLQGLEIQKEKAWTTDTVLKARMHWMETFADPERALEPEQYRKQFEAYEKAALKNASSGRAKDAATVQLNELGLSMYDNSLRTAVVRRERERATLQASVVNQIEAQAAQLPVEQVFPFIAQYGTSGGLSKPTMNMLYDRVTAGQTQNPVIAFNILEYAKQSGGMLPGRNIEKSQEFIAKSAETAGRVSMMGTPVANSANVMQGFIKDYPLAAPALIKAHEENVEMMNTDSAGWASQNYNLLKSKESVDQAEVDIAKIPVTEPAQKQQAIAAYQLRNQQYLADREAYQMQTLGYAAILSNNEVKTYAAGLKESKSPAETRRKLETILNQTLDRGQGERILNEVITRGNVEPETMVLAMNMDKPWVAEVMSRTDNPVKGTDFTNLVSKVRAHPDISRYQKSLIATGAEAVNASDSYALGVATIAAKSIGLRAGYENVDQAVKKAVAELAGKYDYVAQRGAEVRIPKELGMKAGDIQLGLDLAKANVIWMNQAEAGRNIQNSVWMTTQNNKGVQLYFYGDSYPYPVQARTPHPNPQSDDERKKGLPIVKTWEEVRVKGGAALMQTRGLF